MSGWAPRQRHLGAGALLALAVLVCPDPAGAAGIARPTQGTLLGGPSGEAPRPLPLKKTRVRGHLGLGSARVVVEQVFVNPGRDPIEAIYVFPLPERAAVTGTTVRVGGRVIRGRIARRAAVRDAYARARAAGQRVITVDQERANVFTQSVSQIPPGARVEIELSYHAPLERTRGTYELAFPLVVAPRSVPGEPDPSFQKGSGRLPDTERVDDASRITPPVLPSGVRSGRALDIALTIDEGAQLAWVKSPSHPLRTRDLGDHRVRVQVPRRARVPNRDLVVRYRLARSRPRMVIQQSSDGSGFAGISIDHPGGPAKAGRLPRVAIVLDDTASMSGASAATARQVVGELVSALPPGSQVALVPLSGRRGVSARRVSAPTRQALERAMRRLRGRRTRDPVPALRRALRVAGQGGAVVIVSDGWFGNEAELARLVSRVSSVRVFPVVLGAAPNRYFATLLAKAGRGAASFVALGEDPGPASFELARMLSSRPIDEVRVRWPFPVHSVVPRPSGPLFPGRSLQIFARFESLPAQLAAKAVVELDAGAKTQRHRVDFELRRTSAGNASLSHLWARERVAELELSSVRTGASHAATIAKLGIDFGILTSHTSFIAVDEGPAARPAHKQVLVPVDVPAGTRRSAALADSEIFDDEAERDGVRPGGKDELEERRALEEKSVDGKQRRSDADASTPAEPSTAPAPDASSARAPAGERLESDAPAGAGADIAEADEESARMLERTVPTGEVLAATVGNAFRAPRLDGRLSLGVTLDDVREPALGASLGVLMPLSARIAVGGEALVLAPLDADVPTTLSLSPSLLVAVLPRTVLRIGGGPAITTEGDLAGLLGLGLRVRVVSGIGIELRYERSFILDAGDLDAVTLGVGVTF